MGDIIDAAQRAISPQWPEELKAPCSTHGVETFAWIGDAQLWACLGHAHQIQLNTPPEGRTYCAAMVRAEEWTPDGFEVEYADKLKWGQVTFNMTDRYQIAWARYLFFCG